MAKAFSTCDKCGREIRYGANYIAIERNVEYANLSISRDRDEVKIIDSEMLLILCNICGNAFGHDNISKIITAIPLKKSFPNDN